PQALDSADAIIMLLRFRRWDDTANKHFNDACNRGVPIIGLRTSTHAFRGKLGGFGKRVLGEGWVSHWGHHKREACRGVIEPDAKKDSILNGVTDVFADSDVYEAYPPKDVKILMRGLVLENMKPDSKPSTRDRKKDRPINDPAMAVAWTRNYKWPSGKTSRIFCSTMGAATDLQSEGLRRMIVNATYAGLGVEVPKKANVDYVDPYKPLFYGFNTFRRGIKPSDHALGKVLPAGAKKK
ncbi:MAG: ThuA domain-containing protein, partial [Verrucomicrobiota bacterium]|nr:ThuA domain-containing protein [Verrucomicrobiota bacterium]